MDLALYTTLQPPRQHASITTKDWGTLFTACQSERASERGSDGSLVAGGKDAECYEYITSRQPDKMRLCPLSGLWGFCCRWHGDTGSEMKGAFLRFHVQKWCALRLQPVAKNTWIYGLGWLQDAAVGTQEREHSWITSEAVNINRYKGDKEITSIKSC